MSIAANMCRSFMDAQQTILVVDDEERVRAFVCKALALYGYSVVAAADGAEALEVCKGDPRIDAVLLDSNMPVMSGEEVVPYLLALRPDLKIVLSSGYGELEALEGVKGLAGFIQKPYLPKQLAEMLRGILEGGAAPAR